MAIYDAGFKATSEKATDLTIAVGFEAAALLPLAVAVIQITR